MICSRCKYPYCVSGRPCNICGHVGVANYWSLSEMSSRFGEGFGWPLSRGSCFITTAVCEHEDLPDDCQTLTVLRDFRDSYMMATEERVSQVEKYYRIAPSLVERIDQHTDRKGIYGHLRDSFILPAAEAVKAGDNQRAESIYTGMMNWLQAHLA
jgi:hypothetical protein